MLPARPAYAPRGQAQYDAARAFCQRACEAQHGFDTLGMFASVLPFRVAPQRSAHTFCSRLVTGALQHVGVAAVAGMDPALTTPSRLHAALASAAQGVVDTVPARCARLDYAVPPEKKAPAQPDY